MVAILGEVQCRVNALDPHPSPPPSLTGVGQYPFPLWRGKVGMGEDEGQASYTSLLPHETSLNQ
jgi:hypothetical protein